ncbi:hypothetical protein FACS1894137_05740 [Spirochaetia bacterium]|nr:hypothetical protein FACS1894137_05740 [Spirochaetia bacterium]
MSDAQNPITGGWSEFSLPSADEKKILVGGVKPGAEHLSPLVVSKQHVHGWNYLFVANDGVQAIQGNKPFPVIVKVYVAPDKEPIVTQLHEIGHSGFVGSYGQFQDIGPETDGVLKEALGDHLGIDFKALAVSTQLVAGQNYLFAGNVAPKTHNPHEYPAFVTVYKPGQGKARIISIERAWEI